jgi:hypothetical protein
MGGTWINTPGKTRFDFSPLKLGLKLVTVTLDGCQANSKLDSMPSLLPAHSCALTSCQEQLAKLLTPQDQVPYM